MRARRFDIRWTRTDLSFDLDDHFANTEAARGERMT